MATRHEEKFLIDYRQYVLLRDRAETAMRPDEHAPDGSYLITSLYYDDRLDSALDEKLDGVRVHTKYRVRTYGANGDFIRLDRIIYIDDGRIVAIGPHLKLYETCPSYRHMVDLQKLEEEGGKRSA